MSSFPKPDARFRAAAATLAAVALLVTLLIWRPEGVLSVVLALALVLLTMAAGVAVTAVRENPRPTPAPVNPPGQPLPADYGVDADTLEALDPRAVRDRRGLDADTLETLDPRQVQDWRSVNGVSDR